MSSLIGQRSANRGMCAQPCRLTYELLDEDLNEIATPGPHLLSPKDLSSIELLPSLVEAGVASIKIEGRMKSATYVGAVTAMYRHALDRAWAAQKTGEAYTVSQEEKDILAEVFSRGFDEAYLAGRRGNEMMSYSRPNNRGIAVGRIQGIKDRRACIALTKALSARDKIEVWTKKGRFAQTVGPLTSDGQKNEHAESGTHPTFELQGSASVGDRVFRIENSELTRAIKSNDLAGSVNETEGRLAGSLEARVRIILGKPLELMLKDAEGHEATAHGPIIEAARSKAISEEEVIEHIARLGGTPYTISSWDIKLEDEVGLGFSALHKVRRDAIAQLEERVLSAWEDRAKLQVREIEVPKPFKQERSGEKIELAAIVDSQGSASLCIDAGIDELIVTSEDILTGRIDLDLLAKRSASTKISTLLPRVCHDSDFEKIKTTIDAKRTAIAATLGLIEYSRDLASYVEAGWSINATNAYTLELLAREGASSAVVSPELTKSQIKTLARTSSIPLAMVVSGLQEIMVTRHCILMAEGPCDQKCPGCKRRATMHSLRDRKGYLFPVTTDSFGRSHIYNSVVLDLASRMDEVIGTGISKIIVDTTLFSPQEALAQLQRVRTALSSVLAEVAIDVPIQKGTTTGHFNRGIR